MIWLAAGMGIAAVLALLWPLLRPPRPVAAPGPAGAEAGWPETEWPETEWDEARTRLIAQLRDNDLALAERRIGPRDHAEIAAALAEEAEAAVRRFREARRQRAAPVAAEPAPVRPWRALPVAVVVLAAGLGVHGFALRGDLDMGRSPHGADAAGRIPLPPGMAAAPDAAPDIGAMVAGLEARIAAAAPGPGEFGMLLRSYAVLGRQDEIPALVAEVTGRDPGRTDLALVALRAGIASPGLLPGETLGALVEAVIRAEPGNLEAHWYRGLLLARLGHFAPARAELEWLLPRVADNPQAARAVRLLLADLPEGAP